jgi:hypothetical protein
MLIRLAQHQENPIKKELNPWLTEDQLTDAVFSAAVKVPMEWMGVGIVRQVLPFDINEFLQLRGR